MHYRDGSTAKLGDHVRGKPYNYPTEVQGVVVGLKGGENCNLVVAFVAAPLEEARASRIDEMTGFSERISGWANENGVEHSTLNACSVFYDYGTVGEFDLVRGSSTLPAA